MYSTCCKHLSLYPLCGRLSPFIRLNSSATCLSRRIRDANVALFQQSGMQKEKRELIYTSVSQVGMNKGNIIWRGNGRPVTMLYGWVQHSVYGCLRGERDKMGEERWLEIQCKGERIHKRRGERQVVYYRYPSKTNLYCIKIRKR